VKKAVPFASACAICLLVFGISTGDEKQTAGAKSAPSLDSIKKLAGDWVEVDKDGKPTSKVVSSIKVTAGGSAVRELIFPGTDMEMVTMYTQEGPDLFLTHYCILGNQPRLRAEPGSGDKKIVFKLVGGGNLNPQKDAHMGETTLTFVDDDHITLECVKCENGKACETHKISLARKK
jgi:hypothetical protein